MAVAAVFLVYMVSERTRVDTGDIPVLTSGVAYNAADANAGKLNGELERTLDKDVYGGLWIGSDRRLHIGIVGTDAKADAVAKTAVAAAEARGMRDVAIDRVRNSWKRINDVNWAIGGLMRDYLEKRDDVYMSAGIQTDLNMVHVSFPSDPLKITSGQRKIMSIINEKYKGVVYYTMDAHQIQAQ